MYPIPDSISDFFPQNYAHLLRHTRSKGDGGEFARLADDNASIAAALLIS